MSSTDATLLPPLTPEEEVVMNEEIETTIAPFRAFTPAPLLAIMRDQVEEAMRTDPGARRLLAAAVRRVAPDMSAEVAKAGAREEDETKGSGKEGA